VRVLNEADRTDDIIELLTSRLDQAPRDGNALALLLQVARSADRVDDLYYPYAERFYQQSPFSVPYIIALADVYLQQKKFEQSIELFKRAIEAHPEDQPQLQLHMAFAEFNAAAGNYSRALTLVDRAMQLDDSFYLVAAKARYQSKAGQADAAVKTLNDAIAQAGPEESLYLRQQVAQVYAEMDKVDEAMKIYDALVTEYPDFAADFRYEASIVAAQAGAHDVAEQQLLKALDHNPDHAGANNNLGYTWVEAGKNLRRAEAMIRKAVAAEPNQAAYLDSLGWVLYKQGKFTEAVLWLRRAQQARGGNDPIILDHLGDALWQTGEHESAEQIWSVAIGQLRRMKEPSADHKSTLKSLEAKIKALENDQTPAVADVHEPEASEPQLPPAPLQ
jgi:tetratricopeptide (TPR) repeat protein